MKWENLMTMYASTGKPQTQQRKHNEFKMPRWNQLRHSDITETTGCDFLELLNNGGSMTQVYLSALQQLAIDLGARSHVVLPKKMFPKKVKVAKRAVTLDEHRMLCSNLHSYRWSCYLELLWETGAAQSDAASFRIEDMDGDVLVYRRHKTGSRAAQHLSEKVKALLNSLKYGRIKGLFMPAIEKINSKDRASIFRRLCKRCDIEGISLHSYRYAWAERAFQAGMPERLAMVALGHNSSAIHRVYAKGARLVAPSLDDYSPEGNPAVIKKIPTN